MGDGGRRRHCTDGLIALCLELAFSVSLRSLMSGTPDYDVSRDLIPQKDLDRRLIRIKIWPWTFTSVLMSPTASTLLLLYAELFFGLRGSQLAGPPASRHHKAESFALSFEFILNFGLTMKLSLALSTLLFGSAAAWSSMTMKVGK